MSRWDVFMAPLECMVGRLRRLRVKGV
jgi:hypothetical protein